MNAKEKLVEELTKRLHETWEATPGNPFHKIPYGCLAVEDILGAEIKEEIDFEIAGDIIAKAEKQKGFTKMSEREQEFIDGIIANRMTHREPKGFDWDHIQGLK